MMASSDRLRKQLGQPKNFVANLKIGDVVEVPFESDGKTLPFKADVVQILADQIEVKWHRAWSLPFTVVIEKVH